MSDKEIKRSEIDKAFKGASLAEGKSPQEYLVDALRNLALGFWTGDTMNDVCQKLGLAKEDERSRVNLTEKGLRYLLQSPLQSQDKECEHNWIAAYNIETKSGEKYDNGKTCTKCTLTIVESQDEETSNSLDEYLELARKDLVSLNREVIISLVKKELESQDKGGEGNLIEEGIEDISCRILDGVEFKDRDAMIKAIFQLSNYLKQSIPQEQTGLSAESLIRKFIEFKNQKHWDGAFTDEEYLQKFLKEHASTLSPKRTDFKKLDKFFKEHPEKVKEIVEEYSNDDFEGPTSKEFLSATPPVLSEEIVKVMAVEIIHDLHNKCSLMVDPAFEEQQEGVVIESIKSILSSLSTQEGNKGWISVEDQLPEKDQYVVAYINGGENHKYRRVVTFNGQTEWYGDSVYSHALPNNLHNVTHWMPLPEPPNNK